MKYLKVFTDFKEVMGDLGDAEKGRLFTAMLDYAETGTDPDLRGNERFLWRTAKMQIDRERAYAEKKADAGRIGGSSKHNEADASKQKQSKADASQKDKDKEILKEIPTNVGTKKSTAFHAPTLEEVKARCAEMGYTLDPESFMAYYNANGWKVGRNKMVSWESALAGWQSREKDYKPKKQNAALKYEQKPISKSDFDALVVDLGDV